MLTNKITGFSADLLNTVRGILGEAKKCPADCECEKCEAEDEDEKEEAKEGYVPASDEPTDANKKTAQKIRDMMAKEKKPVKEESEELDEISSDMAHRYLKGKRERDYDISADGKSSSLKKPQSFGKMNKDMKSTARALRTIEKAKKTNEEAEQIDEVSKATLGRYINKAKDSIDTASYRQGHKEAHGSSSKPLEKKLTKRHKGISTAVKKLTKEESEQIDETAKIVAHLQKRYGDNIRKSHVRSAANDFGVDASKLAKAVRTKLGKNMLDEEQIDELSKDTMGRYIKKATNQAFNKGFAGGANLSRGQEHEKEGERQVNKAVKRVIGVNKAVNKLTKEEQDFIDSLNTDTLDEARGRPKKAGAKDFTIHPKTKEKLMHNNPADMKRIERLQKNGILEKPKVEAGQHIMNQLSKAKTSMLGGSKINFTHGDSKEVSGTHAAKILTKYAGMKPNEKEDFQKFVGHSHENLMKHV